MVVTQDKPLASVFRQVGSGSFPPVVEMFERGKTIFSRGSGGTRLFLLKGAVKLSRFMRLGRNYCGTAARNSVFGVLSLLTGHRSDRFYHAVAFTSVELLSTD